jgi:cyclic pyranopterin phosphate synthase
MPEFVKGFLAQDQLLSFEAIERIVQVLAKSGIKKVRLTGGEPLMRPNLGQLVKRLANIEGLEQIAMTTNGMLLPPIVRE